MKILIGVGGAGVESLLARVAERIAPGATWIILHVTDAESFVPMEQARLRLPGRGRRVEEALSRMHMTAHASADEVIAAAESWLNTYGIPHQTLMREGKPEQEIIRLAAAERVDLIIVDAGIVEGAPHGPGKHPLGRIARFVTDHALCDVLLIRRFAAPEGDWLPPPPHDGPLPHPRPPHQGAP